MSPGGAAGSGAMSIAPEERAVAPSERRARTTSAPLFLADSAAMQPAMPPPMIRTSATGIASVEVADREVVAAIELFLRHLLAVEHRAFAAKAGPDEMEQFFMGLGDGEVALSCKQRGRRPSATRALAGTHPHPTAPAQVAQPPDMLFAQTVDGFGVGGLFAAAQRSPQLGSRVGQLADLHRVRPVSIGHSTDRRLGPPVMHRQIHRVRETLPARPPL